VSGDFSEVKWKEECGVEEELAGLISEANANPNEESA